METQKQFLLVLHDAFYPSESASVGCNQMRWTGEGKKNIPFWFHSDSLIIQENPSHTRMIKKKKKAHHTSANTWCLDDSLTPVILLHVPDASDPPTTLQESPTRFPPTRKKPKVKDPPEKEKDVKGKSGAKSNQEGREWRIDRSWACDRTLKCFWF